ncbi:phosphate ABC transporter substrate-binding protein PstS [Microbulbifer agarilyticus]|uniref:phosphate ABC transporter substrate-binding protein PstS n=1 Tax=Microbulbifer agarilyticus TaxID=260552 RepID=UPI001C97DE1F|nr:phosphate ABC transporter substrate-binding protein PstS [Microbulbifer agarilyticus]MBY6212971.1 phosphate ABC transporter substrate-binding protein PstS [Microbulbifer agarilyticus]
MFLLTTWKSINRTLGKGALLLTAILISACTDGSRDENVTTDAVTEDTGAQVQLNGSGASFPFPIYAKWFRDFSRSETGVQVNYQPKGSSAGIQDFIAGVVDFAASDAAMTEGEIAEVTQGVVLLPVTAGEVVLAYNLQGVDDLKLPRDVYPEIFLGKIDHWQDPRIIAANPNVVLPDSAITVVTRADASGTSYVFSGHLSAINDNFQSAVGQSTTPNWPGGANFVSAPRNDGVAAEIKQTPGAIGYVNYGVAKLTELPVARLENKVGNFVSPGPAAGGAALANAQFPTGTLPGNNAPNLIAWVPDPAGNSAYPIVSFTWLLVYADQDNDKAAAMRRLVDYVLSDEAQAEASALGYIPLPQNVREKVREAAQFIK